MCFSFEQREKFAYPAISLIRMLRHGEEGRPSHLSTGPSPVPKPLR